jgi:hypothetical protein
MSHTAHETQQIDSYLVRSRKRSYWRGVAAGLVGKFLAIFLLIGLLYFVRPFFWAAYYGVPYSPSKNPLSPDSNEWLLYQAMGFISAFVAGVAAARWSKFGSWSPVLTLVGIVIIISIYQFAPIESLMRLIIWVTQTPLGFLGGAFVYMRRETNLTSHSRGTPIGAP